jgi:hypothetical protein
MYSETGRKADAVSVARRALGLATDQRNQELQSALKADLDRYQAPE